MSVRPIAQTLPFSYLPWIILQEQLWWTVLYRDVLWPRRTTIVACRHHYLAMTIEHSTILVTVDLVFCVHFSSRATSPVHVHQALLCALSTRVVQHQQCVYHCHWPIYVHQPVLQQVMWHNCSIDLFSTEIPMKAGKRLKWCFNVLRQESGERTAV
jgi:hypothetical protein